MTSKLSTESVRVMTGSDTPGSDVEDPVWGEASYAALWDEIGSTAFVFEPGSETADTASPSDFETGDRLDLDWTTSGAGATLTLDIGPEFTGSGQVLLAPDGHLIFIEADPLGLRPGIQALPAHDGIDF